MINWTKKGAIYTRGQEEKYEKIFAAMHWTTIKDGGKAAMLTGSIVNEIMKLVYANDGGYPIAWARSDALAPVVTMGVQFRYKNAEVYTYWRYTDGPLTLIARDARFYKRLKEWHLPEGYKEGMDTTKLIVNQKERYV